MFTDLRFQRLCNNSALNLHILVVQWSATLGTGHAVVIDALDSMDDHGLELVLGRAP